MKKRMMRPAAALAGQTKGQKNLAYYLTTSLLILALVFITGCQAGHCPAM